MKKGRAHTMTRDYTRHGTTTLFAALQTLDGSVMTTCLERHRHQEWLKFRRLIDHQTPADKQLHLVVDNYATHKHPAVQRWAARHQRFHFHFTPTGSSWLIMVERFFRDLTENQLRGAVFTGVEALQKCILAYIEEHDRQLKPFICTAKANDILETVKRAKTNLNNSPSV
jgi:transposase